MSENGKEEDNFEFIKEQIVQKKGKKYKKTIISFCTTIVLAIIFGVIAAFTICIAEPKINNLLHKDEKTENKTPVSFPYEELKPTAVPTGEASGQEANAGQASNKDNNEDEEGQDKEPEVTPEPIIIEQPIRADAESYKDIYSDIRVVAAQTNLSMVKVTSIIEEKDIFENPIEKKIDTSGLVIANNNADLLILVSLDRVATASSIKVAFADNVVADAKIQDYESEINLAVLAVNLADIPKTCLDTIAIAQLGENYSIAVGDPIIALGNPNGYTHSMELGMITSKGSTIQLTDNQLELFNTDIEDNVNSDGVIVDLDGHIIGLITRTLKQDLNEQISTVVGITRIKKIIERMANTQPRIYFGIKAEDMTEEAKKAYDIKNGIYVTEVQANSPAFKAGVKNGDIILQVNDQVVPTTSSFYTSISFYKPGEKVNLKIIRTSSSTNKEIELKAELEEKKQ